jgi:hypothetical protein
MAKRTLASLALLAAMLFPTAGAHGQSLQRLTVQSFVLSADTTSPHVDVPFHLVLTLHVRERVSEIENLDLPVLSGLDLLGDERETVTTPSGTQYRETVTVVAHTAGTMTISAATLQAIDARDGKPKEWFTNTLTLNIVAAPSRVLGNAASAVGAGILAALRFILWLLAWVVGIACLAAIAVLLVRRRRRVAPVAPVAAAPQMPVAERSNRERAQDALAVLRTERTRAAAVSVRAAIWAMVGASDGETLGDVLRQNRSADVTLRNVLIALERSAFTYDSDLSAAIDDACSALERYIETVS